MTKYKTLILVILTLLVSCTGVSIYKHPDYNFPPTDPSQIRVYVQDQEPTYPYIIIGRLVIDATWTMNMSKAEKKVEAMAAQAGADGILIRQADINIYAFNQYVTVQGYTSGDAFYAAIQPHAMYIVEKKLYGYLIKRTE